MLRTLGGIPVYRRQDDPAAMHRNEDMFRAAVEVLREGGAIQIYPEGRSHSEAHLAEFRTGGRPHRAAGRGGGGGGGWASRSCR